jgi:hypothetical protein
LLYSLPLIFLLPDTFIHTVWGILAVIKGSTPTWTHGDSHLSISMSPEMPMESRECKIDLKANQFRGWARQSEGQHLGRSSYSSLTEEKHSAFVARTSTHQASAQSTSPL